jgi:hypothetical protein
MTRRFEVKGKTLKALQEFVDSISFDSPYAWSIGAAPSIISLVARAHSNYMSEDDVVDLVLRESFGFFDARPNVEGFFTATENCAHREKFISILKERFEALPLNYTIRIALVRKVLPIPARLRISEDIHLVTCAPLPSPYMPNRINAAPTNVVAAEHGFIEIKVQGYATNIASSPGVAEAISLAKRLAFNFESSGLFHRSPGKPDVTATITTDDTNQTHSLRLPQDVQWCIGGLAAKQAHFLQWSNESLASNLALHGIKIPPIAKTPEEIIKVTEERLKPVRQFFKAANHPDFASVCAAIEWHQDSLCAENQTFAYLAACIGLEAILGSDETMTGMSKRLADRYAFLLGKNRADREQMSRDYSEVLNLRGQLVHAKTARLKGDALELLNKARAMLAQVIRHEIATMLTGINPEDI